MHTSRISVGLAQIAPVWLDRDATTRKVLGWIEKSANEGCALVVFGEALVPGYPFWVERTDAATFESDLQKSLYAQYRGHHTFHCARKSFIRGFCFRADAQDGNEALYIVELDHSRVLEERHSLDVAGHYSRPDVTRLVVNRKRQATAEFLDD